VSVDRFLWYQVDGNVWLTVPSGQVDKVTRVRLLTVR